MTTYGAEIEKPISTAETGLAHPISQAFFRDLAETFPDSKLKTSDIEPETSIGVELPTIGNVGLDNAFNLQETSTRVTNSLGELADVLKFDLETVQAFLAREGATTVNLSIHPLTLTDPETYRAFVAPKGIYAYIRARGWDHTAGIDAKAHNSPSTGVEPADATRALTVMIGAGPALIGLFGNSPFAEGKLTGYKESRANLWEKMFAGSLSAGDLKTSRFPERPFLTLKDYFQWMFGPETNIHFVMAGGGNYKTFGDGAILIEGNPSVLSYLSKNEVKGRTFKDNREIVVQPHLSHLEAMQFAQFTGARIRYQFNHDFIDKKDFLKALEVNQLEDLLAFGGAKYMYIEGREAGANFPDASLQEVNPDLAVSTFLAPSAIQGGLLANLDEAYAAVMSYPWKQLGELRQSAIKDGLQGKAGDLTVADFSERIIGIAGKGLDADGQKMLLYPEYVLETGQNGADRALADYEKGKSIEQIVKYRNVVI